MKTKGKRIKQINKLVIHEIANGRYACWHLRTCLEEFDTLDQAERWCRTTLDFVKVPRTKEPMTQTERIQEAESHAGEGNPDDASQLIEAYFQGNRTDDLDKRAFTLAKIVKGMKGHPGPKLPRT